MLRGAGTVAISLPFLEEMTTTSVYAASPEPPFRAINVFFGLGVPKQVAAQGLTGGLAPLAAVADKLAILRGVNLFECDGAENNHFDGSGGVFTGREPTNVSTAAGPSLDQVILANKYPQGPDTLITTLMMGSFFRRKLENDLSLTRFVNCWNADGTPVDLPMETPVALFERIFGRAPGTPETPADLKAKHYDRSVLDSVLEQYEHYQGDASGLGVSSRAKIADHLDKVRELEKKLFPDDLSGCVPPSSPGEIPLLHGQPVDEGGGGPVILVDEWVPYWHTMSDLYALALQCDVSRFGQVLFQSAGERLHLQGQWDYNGEIITFDDMADPTGVGGSHEYWHGFNAANANTQMQWHTHFIMSQLVYFLQQLDDPAYTDENGKTILDNALITIGTELGDGNPHDLESVFHAVSGANDRIRTGQIYDLDASATEVYTTLVHSLGVDEVVGTMSAYSGDLDTILL
jgi:hypothetical protein